MDRKDKFEKIFNYSIGCIGLVGVLATVIALFVALKSPGLVINFIEDFSGLPTSAPIVEVTRIVIVPTQPLLPTPTSNPTDTPLVVIPTEVIPTSIPTVQIIPIPVNQSQYSLYDTIEMIIDSVDILPDNTMRWNLSFWNHVNGEVPVGLNNKETYLTDEAGNRYSVINDDFGSGPLGLSSFKVKPGERQKHWIIFSPRVGNAKTFTVGLVNRGCCYVDWKIYTVTINFP